MKALIAARADVNFLGDSKATRTALSCAVEEGHVATVKVLIESGADVNLGRRDGTPLLRAICQRNEELVKILLAAKAKVNSSVIHCRKCVYDEPLYAAIRGDNDSITQLLLEAGADVNLECHRDSSLVAHAISWNDTRVAIKLLELGANVEEAMPHVAYFKLIFKEEHVTLVKELLKRGVTVRSLPVLPRSSKETPAKRKLRVLACVAGTRTLRVLDDHFDRMKLEQLCRNSIRGHMLEVSKVNLFCRVRKLPLPELMQEFLLFGVSLEGNIDEGSLRDVDLPSLCPPPRSSSEEGFSSEECSSSEESDS